MKISELAAQLAVRSPADMLRLLAEEAYEARLPGGGKLCDLTDVKEWLLELSQATRSQEEWREVS